jgi:hypothetical protein
MNFQEMELSHLIMLWQASDGNPPIKAMIEAELQKRIATNTNFSREYFFEICKLNHHAITVSFIPTSKAYELYGPNLTIDILLTEDEMQEMIKNYSSKPSVNTTGNIKAKILVKDNLTPEQIENAKNIGFDTSEIFEILHV